MYLYLSKILPLFVMPLGIALFLCLLAVILLGKSMRKAAMGVIALSFVVLWVGSTPVVAVSLYRHLESQYPPRPMDKTPRADCIVLLGGAISAPLPPRIDIEFNDAVDRVYKTAELYRNRKSRTVIVSAGNQPWSESQWAEAELIRDLLMEWGVPEDSIMLEGSSRNTRENAANSRNIIKAIGCAKPLLVTSAAHMPRAVAAFSKVNVSVTPVSTDIQAVRTQKFLIMDWLPDAKALAMTSEAIREMIGQKVYALGLN